MSGTLNIVTSAVNTEPVIPTVNADDTITPVSYPNAGGLRGAFSTNYGVLYELEVNENIRAGYVSIGGTDYSQAAVSHFICSPDQVETNTYVLPKAIPAQGGALTTDGVGTLTWVPPTVRTFFNRVEVPQLIQHIFSGVTASGRCMFYTTSDGKSTGKSLFSQILHVTTSVTFLAADISGTAYTSINQTSIDNKSIQINATYVVSNTLSKTCDHLAVPNGTKVTLCVLGK
jgi:hypothetical protein